jgi:NitT/TauT family transport system ATP-binding protein
MSALGPTQRRVADEEPMSRTTASVMASPGDSRVRPAAATDVFRAAGLECVYGKGGEAVHALRDVSFSLRAGEFVSIVGPSGCGKSTLLRIVGGLLKPTAGTISGSSEADRLAGKIAMMFQAPVLVPWRNVLENVLLIEELRSGRLQDRAQAEARAQRLLELVRLADFAGKYPFELSGGMQQRAALARALFLEPGLMLLDEPFGALDALTREDMNLELQRICMSREITVLLVTHDLDEALLLADRVVVMSERPGTIVLEKDVPLPRPRSPGVKYEAAFLAAHAEIYKAMHRGSRGSDPVAPGS